VPGPISPEYPLLGLLMAGPNHGYDLHQRLTVELGSVWHVSQSQTYSVLKRLEQRGDVTARRRLQSKLPARQVLHITAAGRKRFKQWLEGAAGTSARTVRLEFLTRLYFAKLLAPEKGRGIYAAQAQEVTRSVRRLRLALSQVPESQTYNRMSLDLRLRQMELVRTWLREIGERFHIAGKGRR
jgi:DNA-binding PadR family transcriptional regulator